MAVRRIAILGSTGSIGAQALDVIERSGERFSVASLAVHRSADAVVEQALRTGAPRVGVVDPDAAARARERLPGVDVLEGEGALTALASDHDADVVLNAVVGAAGLRATLAALDAGRIVALANKESCVAGGPLVSKRLAAGACLVPVDSEHAAVHMCLRGEPAAGVSRIVVTASGGPFRGRTREELAHVRVEDALAHPTWRMGRKITVDSATLMNKGLEVIEAHVLFGLPYSHIEVVGHPQSVVHCLVEMSDGSWKASLSPPDMRVPIAYALGYPDRVEWGADGVRWSEIGSLTFEPVDGDVFRCLALAYEAGRLGGTMPAVLNAANEVAVAAFLDARIGFLQIADTVEAVLESGTVVQWDDPSLDDVLAADAWARTAASQVIDRL